MTRLMRAPREYRLGYQYGTGICYGYDDPITDDVIAFPEPREPGAVAFCAACEKQSAKYFPKCEYCGCDMLPFVGEIK